MNASLQPAAAAVENPKPVKRSEVVRLSQPQSVSMAEVYFDLVHPDHFWAARRFDVLVQLAGALLGPQKACAEIGCGNGVLQNQLAKRFGVTVDGIDLCLKALEESVAESGTLYYYDVFQRAPEFKHKYDVIFLFDVLEHIRDDLGFLNACLYHLKAGGHVVVNVPARKELFSSYDIVAGHVRRYRSERTATIDGLGWAEDDSMYVLGYAALSGVAVAEAHPEILRRAISLSTRFHASESADQLIPARAVAAGMDAATVAGDVDYGGGQKR